nr:hypothetical protein [uncultured Methanolobus sp.]
MNFKEIKFGLAAAEKEKSNYPNLLINGFLDEYGYIDQIIDDEKFLVLGPKGSGKSAIGSRIDLLAKNKEIFTKQYYLGNFPYKPFAGILPGNDAPQSKLPDHWEFVLLIAVLNSFINDPKCKYKKNKTFEAVVDVFKNEGVLPTEELTQIIQKTSKKTFRASLHDLLSGEKSSEETKTPFDLKMLYATLQDVCYSITTKSRHIIIIDGLDDILTHRDNQYVSLSSLILATDRMNSKFKENGVNAFILVLCRSDIYDKLPGTNNNKIKRDSGIMLDWYQDTKDTKSTNLVKLINLRAKLALGRELDVFDEFFPNEMESKPIEKYLLEYTRHTPRDVIQLVNEIQRYTKGKKVTRNDILNGTRSYSTNYFVTEIKDELVGYLKTEDIEKTIQLLGLVGKSVFDISEIRMIVQNDNRFDSLNLNEILTQLFNCNALGNYWDNRLTFKYWNPHAVLNLSEKLVIHKGMRKGLNLKGKYDFMEIP